METTHDKKSAIKGAKNQTNPPPPKKNPPQNHGNVREKAWKIWTDETRLHILSNAYNMSYSCSLQDPQLHNNFK